MPISINVNVDYCNQHQNIINASDRAIREIIEQRKMPVSIDVTQHYLPDEVISVIAAKIRKHGKINYYPKEYLTRRALGKLFGKTREGIKLWIKKGYIKYSVVNGIRYIHIIEALRIFIILQESVTLPEAAEILGVPHDYLRHKIYQKKCKDIPVFPYPFDRRKKRIWKSHIPLLQERLQLPGENDLSVKEFAKIFGVHHSSITYWIRKKSIKANKVIRDTYAIPFDETIQFAKMVIKNPEKIKYVIRQEVVKNARSFLNQQRRGL